MKKYNITVNGKEYEVEVEETAGDGKTKSNVAPVSIEKTQVQTKSASVEKEEPVKEASTSGAEGSEKVVSPMPGTILKVNVTVDQQVKKGDILCVLEAMKMENDIVSPIDGKVAGVSVSKGSTVDSGDLLISLD